jgi:hypothetical protein
MLRRALWLYWTWSRRRCLFGNTSTGILYTSVLHEVLESVGANIKRQHSCCEPGLDRRLACEWRRRWEHCFVGLSKCKSRRMQSTMCLQRIEMSSQWLRSSNGHNGHRGIVCGLKYNEATGLLASGANGSTCSCRRRFLMMHR